MRELPRQTRLRLAPPIDCGPIESDRKRRETDAEPARHLEQLSDSNSADSGPYAPRPKSKHEEIVAVARFVLRVFGNEAPRERATSLEVQVGDDTERAAHEEQRNGLPRSAILDVLPSRTDDAEYSKGYSRKHGGDRGDHRWPQRQRELPIGVLEPVRELQPNGCLSRPDFLHPALPAVYHIRDLLECPRVSLVDQRIVRRSRRQDDERGECNQRDTYDCNRRTRPIGDRRRLARDSRRGEYRTNHDQEQRDAAHARRHDPGAKYDRGASPIE